MSSIAEIDSSNFEELVLKSDKPVLVDFWASWCGPCRMMAPVLEEIAGETPAITVCKLNTDLNQNIALQYNIASIPAFLLFKNGKVVETVVGAMPKESLLSKISSHFI